MQTPKLITVNNKTYLGTISGYSTDPDVSQVVTGIPIVCIEEDTLYRYIKEYLLDGFRKISLIGETSAQIEDLSRENLDEFNRLNKLLTEAEELKDNFIVLLCFERLLGK